MKILTDSLWAVHFDREVIAKNKSLVEEVMKLQGTVTNEQGARKVIEKDLAQVKRSVLASEELTAKLAESNKLLDAARAKLWSINGEASREGSE